MVDTIKHPEQAEYAHCGSVFEYVGIHSHVTSRLILNAYIHRCSGHCDGTFSTPKDRSPRTYIQLQQFTNGLKRLQQHSNGEASSSRDLVGAATYIAAKFRACVYDGAVAKHIIECTHPTTERATAAEATAKGASAASGPVTEHTRPEALLQSTPPSQATRPEALLQSLPVNRRSDWANII